MAEHTRREPAHWNPRSDTCVMCRKAPTVKGRREFCSDVCQVMASRDRRTFGEILRSVTCQGCGEQVDLFENPPEGRLRKRVDTKYCDLCYRHRHHRGVEGLIPVGIFRSLGTTCGICGKAVDLGLTREQDPRLCASVDHIVPAMFGGSDTRENLVVAHFGCNQTKHLKPEPSAPAGPSPWVYKNQWKVFAREVKDRRKTCSECERPAFSLVPVVHPNDGGDIYDEANVVTLCRKHQNERNQTAYRASCRQHPWR